MIYPKPTFSSLVPQMTKTWLAEDKHHKQSASNKLDKNNIGKSLTENTLTLLRIPRVQARAARAIKEELPERV